MVARDNGIAPLLIDLVWIPVLSLPILSQHLHDILQILWLRLHLLHKKQVQQHQKLGQVCRRAISCYGPSVSIHAHYRRRHSQTLERLIQCLWTHAVQSELRGNVGAVHGLGEYLILLHELRKSTPACASECDQIIEEISRLQKHPYTIPKHNLVTKGLVYLFAEAFSLNFPRSRQLLVCLWLWCLLCSSLEQAVYPGAWVVLFSWPWIQGLTPNLLQHSQDLLLAWQSLSESRQELLGLAELDHRVLVADKCLRHFTNFCCSDLLWALNL
mmetsp:Transcript_45014/g.106932  ORF Transcript_45014/g.106932 Transcript_45014/m.106932 type:complete len:271 (+) Transcript_45014:896-1708(+)